MGMIQCNVGHFYDSRKHTLCPFCDAFPQEFNSFNTREKIKPISTLETEMSALVQMDVAPDGLPRCLSIGRNLNKLNIRNEINSYAGGNFSISPEHAKMIEILESTAIGNLLSKRFTELPGIKGRVLITKRPLARIAPPTLFAQILGIASPLDGVNRRSMESKLQAMTAAFHRNDDAKAEEKIKEIDAEKFLVISSENGFGYVISRNKESEIIRDSFSLYQDESFNLLQPSFEITKYREKITNGFVDNSNEYSKALLDMAKIQDGRTIAISVSRRKIANLFNLIASQLQEQHSSGFAHCDVKPSNILTLSGEVSLIDSLRVPINEISVGFTPNYCAPEQVLSQPVGPATDIYNLGLMILKLLNGVLFGSIKEYVVPTGGQNLTHVKLLESPDVFLDSVSSHVPKDGIPSWRTFLRCCLAFDVKARFPDIGAFMQEFSRLMDHFPPIGNVEFPPNFGDLTVFQSRLGEEYVGWKLFDE